MKAEALTHIARAIELLEEAIENWPRTSYSSGYVLVEEANSLLLNLESD